MQGVPLFFNLPWILALVVTMPILPKDLKFVGNFAYTQITDHRERFPYFD
jgi:hypothetical protein